MKIDPHIFRVLGPFLPILSPQKPQKLNFHFGHLPPPAKYGHTIGVQGMTVSKVDVTSHVMERKKRERKAGN